MGQIQMRQDQMIERKPKQMKSSSARRGFGGSGIGEESFGDDAADEVVVADGAVGRDVDLADPLVELVGLELLADGGEDVAEVGDGDGAGGVLVEDAEGVAERAVEGLRAEVGAHEVEEAREVEGGRELLLRGDVAELRLRGVAAEGAHEDAELRGRDAAVAVGVEEREGLPHGGDLVVREVLAAAHGAAGSGSGGISRRGEGRGGGIDWGRWWWGTASQPASGEGNRNHAVG